jgi:hypothetical protein
VLRESFPAAWRGARIPAGWHNWDQGKRAREPGGAMHDIPQETYIKPRRRPRLRRALLMTAGILTVGVAVAACGGGLSRPGAAMASTTTTAAGPSTTAASPSGCVNTTQAPAATAGASGPLLPTTDPFYKRSGSLAHDAPGTILRTRTIAFAEGRANTPMKTAQPELPVMRSDAGAHSIGLCR